MIITSGVQLIRMQPLTECATAGCPVVTADFNITNLMPKAHNDPASDQQQALDKQRVASSIPIGVPYNL